MKESSVLHFSSTKMSGHRQVLKRQGLNLYSQIKDTLWGAEHPGALEPFENRNKLWMLHNLHVLSPIQLGGLQSWVSTILHYIHSMNQLHFCLFNPPIQSFDSLTAERKWTNLTRVILSESSIHRCLKTLNSPDDTLDAWYTYAYGISFNLERKPKEKRQFQTA